MISNPFFSILIPTLNRPELVVSAIDSVLNQDFSNFEVIISNNGACDSTRKSIAKYLKDPRVKYYESKQISNMVDHWDKIGRLFTGKYFLILTDRCLLKQGALHYLWVKLAAEENAIKIVSWPWDLYLDKLDILLPASGNERSIVEINSTKYLMKLAGYLGGVDYPMPRGMNSCVNGEFFLDILRKYNNVFRSISPDMTFSFFCLMNSRSFHYVTEALMVAQGVNVSNGGVAYASTAEKYLLSLNIDNPFKNVPCKVPFVVNTVAEDFLNISKICSREDIYKSFSLVNYYIRLLSELDAKVIAHKISFYRLYLLRTEIYAALFAEGPAIRQSVKLARRRIFITVTLRLVRRVLVDIVNLTVGSRLNVIRGRLILNRTDGIKYNSALESAGFK